MIPIDSQAIKGAYYDHTALKVQATISHKIKPTEDSETTCEQRTGDEDGIDKEPKRKHDIHGQMTRKLGFG